MSSKKMKRMIIILAVLLLFAVGGYLIADAIIGRKEKAIADEEASLHLFSFDPNAIDKVTLDTKEGFFKMEFVDSEWAITETDYPHTFTLNAAYISTVCSYMSELTATTKFEADNAKLADYGLDDPVVLTCSAGGTDYILHVGNATPTQEYFYAMLPDNDTVFGIDYEYGTVLYGDTSYLKSPFMINSYDVNIAQISLERDGDMVFDFVKKGNFWDLKSPALEANIDYTQVDSLITSLVRLEVDAFVGLISEGYAPADFKLDKPYCTLKLTDLDGQETIIDFAPYDVNDGMVYLLYRNEEEIATMSQSKVGFLNAELSEFLNDYILPLNLEDTASVDVSVDDISFRMEMDAAAGKYTFDGMDISAFGTEGTSTFRALFDTMANLTFEALALDADVDVTAEPSAVFHYTLTDGTETELSLIAADDTTYWALVDGKYTGMTVRRRTLSSSTGVLAFHERMMDLIAESQSNAS